MRAVNADSVRAAQIAKVAIKTRLDDDTDLVTELSWTARWSSGNIFASVGAETLVRFFVDGSEGRFLVAARQKVAKLASRTRGYMKARTADKYRACPCDVSMTAWKHW